MTHRPVPVTDDTFREQVLEADTPVLVDFWAPWCGPCRMLAPILEEVAGEQGERLIVAKVDTDEHSRAAQSYGVRSIPTLILFADGEEVARQVGALPKRALTSWIEQALAVRPAEPAPAPV